MRKGGRTEKGSRKVRRRVREIEIKKGKKKDSEDGTEKGRETKRIKKWREKDEED